MPFGGGWISWTAAPRMALVGTAELGGRELRLEGAAGYHDHNWGRWYWGDDVGWEWGCFQASADGPALVEGDGRGPWSCRTIVVARTTDRSHRVLGAAIAAVGMDGRRLLFTGPSVTIEWSGRLDGPVRRVPGALAALHADRARPRLPAALHVRAEDGVSHLVVDFTAVSAAQVIVADPFRRGYGFIHELAGSYSCRGRLCGRSVESEGLAIVEYVR